MALTPALADLPSIRLHALSPPGGKAGTTFAVGLDGGELDGLHALEFSHPGITAVPALEPSDPLGLGPEPLPNQFTVTIAPDVPSGIYEARVSGRFGVSNPRAFAVGRLQEVSETEPNDAVAPVLAGAAVPLETTVNGSLGGATDIDGFKFSLKAGERVVIDCWAERLGSRLDPVLVLYDAAGREIDRSHDANRRDPFLDFAPPAGGDFAVEVRDLLYAGSGEHFYRLSLSAGPRVDFVFPPAGLPGTKGRFQLYGRNLPGGEPAQGVELAGKPLERLEVEIEIPAAGAAPPAIVPWPLDLRGAAFESFVWRAPPERGLVDPVLIGIAAAPVALEVEPNDAPGGAQKVLVPCEVAGRFDADGGQDWFTFDAAQGDVWRIEVLAQRLGRLCDPYLLVERVVKDEKGVEEIKDLEEADDTGGEVGGPGYRTASSDPASRFVAPAAGTYRVLVKDLYGGSDPRNVYRLAVRPESPDFRLVAVPRHPASNREEPALSSLLVRRGGTAAIDVLAFRRDGFAGEIAVAVAGLPSWVSSPGAIIGPGRTAATLILRAADDAPAWRGRIRVDGRARIGDAERGRLARPATVSWPGPRGQTVAGPRLAADLALAVAPDLAPLLVEAGTGSPLAMSRAGTLEVPVAIVRRGWKGKVTLAAADLPPGVEAQDLVLDGEAASGAVKLQVKKEAPAGSFTLHLRAAAKVTHRRDPEAAEAAAARKGRAEKAAAEIAAAAKAAVEAKTAADAAAENAVRAAEKAGEALAAVPAEGRAAAEGVKAAAGEVLGLARVIKEAADQKAAAADARAKAAAEALAAAVKRAEAAAKAANPAEVDETFASTPFTVEITEAPIRIGGPASVTLKQGAKAEAAIAITRFHGCAEAVEVTLVLPGGVSGLESPAVSLAGGEAQKALAIAAGPGATAGRHAATLRAAVKWNGQDFQVARALEIVVEKAE